MKDSEYIEMTRLFDSLIKRADTLRELFPGKGKVTDKVKSLPLFKSRWWLLDLMEKDAGDLVGLINGCEDWTSNKFTASGIYRKMREFVSATSRMPEGISGPYKRVRSLCATPIEIIPGTFPDLYHPMIRALLAEEFYQIAVDDGRISPPFTWNGRISDLKNFLDENVVWQKPADYYNMTDKTGHRKWEIFDCLFRKPNGDPITAKQLRDA